MKSLFLLGFSKVSSLGESAQSTAGKKSPSSKYLKSSTIYSVKCVGDSSLAPTCLLCRHYIFMSDPIVQKRCVGLHPVADKHARILILGSMPSVASLEASHYYANPTNRFWPLMAELFPLRQKELESSDFHERYNALKSLGIALWDTIGSCIRIGSQDNAIRDAVPNDVAGFLRTHAEVQLVLLNGTKSRDMWMRYLAEISHQIRPGIVVRELPSTSAANAIYTLATLKSSWGAAVEGYYRS